MSADGSFGYEPDELHRLCERAWDTLVERFEDAIMREQREEPPADCETHAEDSVRRTAVERIAQMAAYLCDQHRRDGPARVRWSEYERAVTDVQSSLRAFLRRMPSTRGRAEREARTRAAQLLIWASEEGGRLERRETLGDPTLDVILNRERLGGRPAWATSIAETAVSFGVGPADIAQLESLLRCNYWRWGEPLIRSEADTPLYLVRERGHPLSDTEVLDRWRASFSRIHHEIR